MQLSRRDFLKLSGATVGGLLVSGGPTGMALAQGITTFDLHKPIGETPTICCFCGVGCGAIVAAQDGRVVNLEGDPDHPVNQGSLCSKGLAMAQLNTVDGEVNARRLQKPQYRKAGGTTWEEVEWDWALEQIARRVKDTRDEYFIEIDDDERMVNRVEAIASLGGAALDNEECSLISKAMRALGLVYIEHQARI
jgi:formate dehydrogenase major subunit